MYVAFLHWHIKKLTKKALALENFKFQLENKEIRRKIFKKIKKKYGYKMVIII